MGTRLTIDQLEKMKTHELADMLANVVLLLRRMPDVECKQLIQPVPGNQNGEWPPLEHVSAPASSYTREELEERNLRELKALAKELNVRGFSTMNKGGLIVGILAKSVNGHSEQRAMLDM
jgi:Rho termination factor, N-terminal domain